MAEDDTLLKPYRVERDCKPSIEPQTLTLGPVDNSRLDRTRRS